MNPKIERFKVFLLLHFFAFSLFNFSLYAHWSVIENVEKGKIEYGRTIAIDRFGHKHIVYTKILDTHKKGVDVVWLYQRTDSVYNHWEIPETLFRYNNQAKVARDYTPAITVDNNGEVYTAWAYTDGSTGNGEVFFKKTVGGAWQDGVSICGAKLQPGKVAIAVNSDLSEMSIAFFYGITDIPSFEWYYSTSQGAAGTWNIIPASSPIVTGYPSICYDKTAQRYMIYIAGSALHCIIGTADSIIGSIWEWTQCNSDPITGDVHLAYIENTTRNLIYKSHPNGDSDPANWINTTILTTVGEAEYGVSIAAYNDVVGVLQKRDYFEYRTQWDTIPLPEPVTNPGWCVNCDTAGYGHIFGYWEPTNDSVYYFTNHTVSRTVIIPDSSWDTTYPGVSTMADPPENYIYTIKSRGNIIDTIDLFAYDTKPGWTAVFAKGTAILLPESTFVDTLTITPDSTIPACTIDSTWILAKGVDWAVDTIRDSAFTFTKVMIDVALSKESFPDTGVELVSGDTITYYIIAQDTWYVPIDSVTIYDIIDPVFDTAWVENATAGTYYFTIPNRDTLIWTIWNMPARSADTLTLKVILPEFDCDSIIAPQNVSDFAYSPDCSCVFGDTTDIVIHYIDNTTSIDLRKSSNINIADTLQPGDTVKYILECENIGEMPGFGVTIIDSLDTLDIESVLTFTPLPDTQTNEYLKWNVGCIEPESTFVCSFAVIVNREYKCITPVDTLTNYGVASGDPLSVPNPAYSDTIIHKIVRLEDVRSSKSAIPPTGSRVPPSATIHYTITCVNDTFEIPYANCVVRGLSLVDHLDPNIDSVMNISGGGVYTPHIITWTVDSLAPGDTVQTTFDAVVADDALNDSILNYAHLTYSTCIDIFTDTTVHYIAYEEIKKDASPDPGTCVYEGDTIKYFLKYFNWSGDTVDSLYIKDSLDTQVDMIWSSHPYTIANNVVTWGPYTVLPGDSFPSDTTWINLWVEVEYSQRDTIWNFGIFEHDTVADTMTIFHTYCCNLGIDKSAEPQEGSTVFLNDTIQFTIYCKNIGGSLDNISIVDTVDIGRVTVIPASITGGGTWVSPTITWHFAPWQVDANTTLYFDAYVNDDTLILGDTTINWIRVSGSGAIGSCSAYDSTIHIIGAERLYKEAEKPRGSAFPNGSIVRPGDTLWYKLGYTNSSPDTIDSVFVVDTLCAIIPALITTVDSVEGGISRSIDFGPPIVISYELGAVLSNSTEEMFFRAIVTPEDSFAYPRRDTIYNIAHFVSYDNDSISAMAISNQTYHPLGVPHDTIIKSATVSPSHLEPDLVSVGDTITYTLTVQNSGTDTSYNLTVVDTVNTVRLEIIDTGGGDTTNGVITWQGQLPVLAPNAEHNFIWKGVVNMPAGSKGVVTDTFPISNSCYLIYEHHDPARVDTVYSNTILHYLTVKYGVELWALPDTTHTVINTAFWGDTVNYNLRVINIGQYLDDIKLWFTSSWQCLISDTLVTDAEPDSIIPIVVTLIAPDSLDTDTTWIFAESVKEPFGKTGDRDSVLIITTAEERVPKIIVEPDTSGVTEVSEDYPTIAYVLRIINAGNGLDTVSIEVDTSNSGWTYTLTYENGKPIVDTAIQPGDTVKLYLNIDPPSDFMEGLVSSSDTTIIWGISSWDENIRDSATVITEATFEELSDKSIHNYPNPFRRKKGTTFIFTLPKDAKPSLVVYDRTGQVIDIILDGKKTFTNGRHELPRWYATNKEGKTIAAGTYLYILKTADKTIIKKIVVLPEKKR